MVGGVQQVVHRISVVVPVYQGRDTLEPLVARLSALTEPTTTPGGAQLQVAEVVLVHDCGGDGSDEVIDKLAAAHRFVQPIWLSRNFGQHAATLAGIAATSASWVATLDEDGMHDPSDLARLLDAGLAAQAQLIYGKPDLPPPHGAFRNWLSISAKRVFAFLAENTAFTEFHSFRLIHGEIARSLAAFCGNGVYLDVALAWVVGSAIACPVRYHSAETRPSGYDFPRLIGHFFRLALTSGTKPLRFISILGCLSLLFAAAFSVYVIFEKVTQQIPIAGWASSVIIMAWIGGAILFSLGVISEYLGLALTIVMGKPLYLVVSNRERKDRP